MTAITSRLNRLERNARIGQDKITILWRPLADMLDTGDPGAKTEFEQLKEKHKDNPNVLICDWQERDL